MFECLVLGDSIAVGTKMFRPDCVSYAKTGINSRDWNRQYGNQDLDAKTTIISLGSNDFKNINSESELRAIRAVTKSNRVYWIVPAIKPDIQRIIKLIAADWGDQILHIPEISKDNVHPTMSGYRQLAKAAQ